MPLYHVGVVAPDMSEVASDDAVEMIEFMI